MGDFWNDAEVIFSYSRAQAIADGVLVGAADLVPDEPGFVQQAGWKVHVALTAAVAGLVRPNSREVSRGQSLKGRLWDLLYMAFMQARRSQGSDTVLFSCIFWVSGRQEFKGAGQRTVTLKAVIGPGDEAEPVLTIMFPHED